MNIFNVDMRSYLKPILIIGSIVFMYLAVLAKLGFDWWTDDNYSHGLLVPFVIAYLIWHRADDLKATVRRPEGLLGGVMIAGAAFLLLAGTLGAVLAVQRASLILMLVGTIIYFFGREVLKKLFVPFVLFILAIPIPNLIFNKIAFPLQLIASRIAEKGIQLAGIAAERIGNVIEIIPIGTDEIVELEVVEACSGIRSLMTLITLALILGYFTRERMEAVSMSFRQRLMDRDLWRIIVLMASAVPIAIVTNAGRVMITGLITYYYGQETAEGTWHDISGSFVFLVALVMLIALNFLLKRLLPNTAAEGPGVSPAAFFSGSHATSFQYLLPIFLVIVLAGAFVNWFQMRGEIQVERRPLIELPDQIGKWVQEEEDIRFDEETEKILRASDYVMRDYFGPGKRLNLYIGYYESQRSGATYHSPQSCLPGTGWEMKDRELIDVTTPAGRKFTVNRYIVQRGEHKEFLIYWYQGRGRTSPSEYTDRLLTSLDSVTKRRSDGGMVRIMTPIGKDPEYSLASAIDLTALLADDIGRFLPD